MTLLCACTSGHGFPGERPVRAGITICLHSIHALPCRCNYTAFPGCWQYSLLQICGCVPFCACSAYVTHIASTLIPCTSPQRIKDCNTCPACLYHILHCIKFLPSITLHGFPYRTTPGLHHSWSKNYEQMSFMHGQALHQLSATCQGCWGYETTTLSSLAMYFCSSILQIFPQECFFCAKLSHGWMDGVWGLHTATDHCSSMQNLEQAPSKHFALNTSECSCGFVQAGIADPLLKQLWPRAACPTQHIPEQGWMA